ncbi:hypothetical protein DSM03_10525 [Leeuwenhoekiella aestuarii]|uniref:Uncharacterized protein n=1 Tax=Leeuwenhoekiella aestuarii TaxID=2249426 RepID=A0A4Q0NQC2_9FLAO|nr:hypothetical protein DSM04_10625 [Leeuwenhoekiella aestuarii]RXG14493.1 hypothetical protein DSM03_10525 [Leeuwenhoekiella aestuarii]
MNHVGVFLLILSLRFIGSSVNIAVGEIEIDHFNQKPPYELYLKPTGSYVVNEILNLSFAKAVFIHSSYTILGFAWGMPRS